MLSPDGWLAESRTAETPVASTVPEPHGKPGSGLWGHPGLLAPPYIEHVAGALMASGHPEADAYHEAVGIVENWAAGHDGHGHAVHPDVQSAAAENIAEWEALRARYAGGGKRFNPYHLPVGPGGGEFTGPGGGGGGAKAKGGSGGKTATQAPAKQRPAAKQAAAKPRHPSRTPGDHAQKAQLLARARADRAEAHKLQAQLHVLEAQLKTSAATSKKAAAAHKAAAAGKTVTGKVASSASSKSAAAAKRATAATTASLQLRVSALKTRIDGLLAQAKQLEAQAHQLRSMQDVPVERRYPDGCWG